jgi:hypothetical protein
MEGVNRYSPIVLSDSISELKSKGVEVVLHLVIHKLN